MKFRIYYSDREPYDGEGTKDAMNAPTMGAIVVKQEAPCNIEGFACRYSTFFCWEKANKKRGTPERWAGKDDLFGISRYWATEKGAQKILQGEEIEDSLFHKLRELARTDGYLDKRTG